MSETKYCFAPVVDAHTRVLILGSLPGEASLAHGQYYGHPQNRFWRLTGRLIERDLTALRYPERLQALLDGGLGLWDVVAAAKREGSLDSNIRERVENDLASLVRGLPQLAAIAFNGGTAARIGQRQLDEQATRYALHPLPSSSPAFTLPFEQKYAAWSVLRQYLI
ncbi:DNA-deoxyinosine glycosylase [Chitinimonas arctica]|uniref:DNA-deoxyinosine glycosylase n=1 Tax=Chitinimonas arctica TaxID=2594795 RepID=A0A516SK73_9NEIS|nr:DNA-deoxyinosine glycosylase [Chitinimonas arctica]QDQ28561.1 DNA-deoxyinosine glycosylase [Chitinimonas arctica]